MTFASKNLTAGQLNAMVKMIGGKQAVLDCLSGKRKVLISQKEVTKHLECIGEVVLPAITEPFNPSDFFKTRKGLYVWVGFHDRILPATKQVNSVPEATIVSHKLTKAANDAEIRAQMPANHVFEDVNSFCAHLANMIDRQSSLGYGDLTANGYANIFYVHGVKSEVSAVSVFWGSASREWHVLASAFVGSRAGVGGRAFSSN